MSPIVFFFNDPATTEIYTLSLHDALPILRVPLRQHVAGRLHGARVQELRGTRTQSQPLARRPARGRLRLVRPRARSAEHTSELQSQSNIVCQLLHEKYKHASHSDHGTHSL